MLARCGDPSLDRGTIFGRRRQYQISGVQPIEHQNDGEPIHDGEVHRNFGCCRNDPEAVVKIAAKLPEPRHAELESSIAVDRVSLSAANANRRIGLAGHFLPDALANSVKPATARINGSRGIVAEPCCGSPHGITRSYSGNVPSTNGPSLALPSQ
jgi:hypothetical protein